VELNIARRAPIDEPCWEQLKTLCALALDLYPKPFANIMPIESNKTWLDAAGRLEAIIGMCRGWEADEPPRTWKNGPFTYEEEIVSGVVHLYSCKYENADVTTNATRVQSTPRLSQHEVENRFADFVAAHLA
jgi:hypothetical protein